MDFQIVKTSKDNTVDEPIPPIETGLEQRESDDDDLESDKKMPAIQQNRPDDEQSVTNTSNSNLDDSTVVNEQVNPTTILNTAWTNLPDRLLGDSIKQMPIRIPDHGELEPFLTIRNMHIIARRIRETTFGKIFSIPGHNVATVTKPPR
jgi:hypothetical protein